MGYTDEYVNGLLAEIVDLRDREAMLVDALCIARNYMPAETALVRNEVVQVDISLVADAFNVCAESAAAWKQKIIDDAFGEPVAWDVYVACADAGYTVDDLEDAQLIDDCTNHEAVATPLYRKPEVKNDQA